MRLTGMALALAALPIAAGTAQAQAQQSAADAGADARRLGECLVGKTTGEDRIAVMRWVAMAVASAEATDDVLTIDETKRAGIDRAMAAVFQRLFTVDCAEQARPLMAARDNRGFEAAGSMLGQIAMREVMSDPAVQAALTSYVGYLDADAFAAIRP